MVHKAVSRRLKHQKKCQYNSKHIFKNICSVIFHLFKGTHISYNWTLYHLLKFNIPYLKSQNPLWSYLSFKCAAEKFVKGTIDNRNGMYCKKTHIIFTYPIVEFFLDWSSKKALILYLLFLVTLYGIGIVRWNKRIK